MPTVEGDEAVEIAAGTQPNTRITLRGKGVPRLGQPNLRGDQVVNVVVNFPTKLSAKERELLEKLRNVQGGASASASVGAGAGAAGGAAGTTATDGGADAAKKKKGGGFFGGFGK